MPTPGLRFLMPIVARKDDDRVVVDAQVLEIIEQGAEIRVQLQRAIGPIALPGFSLELRTRGGEVHERMVDVEEERFASIGALLDERFAAPQELRVDVCATSVVETAARPDAAAKEVPPKGRCGGTVARGERRGPIISLSHRDLARAFVGTVNVCLSLKADVGIVCCRVATGPLEIITMQNARVSGGVRLGPIRINAAASSVP